MDIQFDAQNSILLIKPTGVLRAEDFLQLAATLDPYLQQHNSLKGLMVETAQFPGWANLDAFIAHVKFIKNHQAKIQKIALVTNSKLADFGKFWISIFLQPEVKRFPYGQAGSAKQWIMQ